MQSLEDLRLRGLISPSVSRPLSVAEAARIAGTTPTPTPGARTSVAGRKPAAATRTRTVARGDGLQWISESRANSRSLPPGRYRYRDRSGRVHYRDVGHAACMASLRERRLERADITGGFSDREIRDGWAVRAAGRFQVVR